MPYISHGSMGVKKIFQQLKFWGARGYFAYSVGRNGDVIRKYIQNQEDTDKELDKIMG